MIGIGVDADKKIMDLGELSQILKNLSAKA